MAYTVAVAEKAGMPPPRETLLLEHIVDSVATQIDAAVARGDPDTWFPRWMWSEELLALLEEKRFWVVDDPAVGPPTGFIVQWASK